MMRRGIPWADFATMPRPSPLVALLLTVLGVICFMQLAYNSTDAKPRRDAGVFSIDGQTAVYDYIGSDTLIVGDSHVTGWPVQADKCSVPGGSMPTIARAAYISVPEGRRFRRIIIFGGSSHFAFSRPLDSYVEATVSLVDWAFERSPDVVVMSPMCIAASDKIPQPPTVEDARTMAAIGAAIVKAARPAVDLVHAGPAMYPLLRPELMRDRGHLNEAGYRKLSQLFPDT